MMYYQQQNQLHKRKEEHGEKRLGARVINSGEHKYGNLKNKNGNGNGNEINTTAVSSNRKSSTISNNMLNLGVDEGLRVTVLPVAVPNPSLSLKTSSVSTCTAPPISIQEIKKANIGTRLLLSDEVVNIWEFCIKPGERCCYHVHTLPYVFVNLTKSLTQALDLDGRATGKPSMQKGGQITFVNERSLGSHAVRNVGEETFLQFVVEFKHIKGVL